MPRRGAIVVATVLMLWTTVSAIRFDWTERELECARTVGVDLKADPEPGSSGYVRRLAWLADLVIVGTVSAIHEDPRGPYSTLVDVSVRAVLKGNQTRRDSITVALESGPVYAAGNEKLLWRQAVNEPTFTEGETVLLFLTEGTRDSGGAVNWYTLGENWYRIVNNSKFTITAGTATLQGWGSGVYELAVALSAIDEVVRAQSTKCEAVASP